MAEKQWMTYSQIAERLGVTPDAIRHRSRKEGWQRQEGNDGKIRVLIDPELLSEIPARSGTDSAPDSVRNSGQDSDRSDREIRRIDDQSQILLRLIDQLDRQRTEHQEELDPAARRPCRRVGKAKRRVEGSSQRGRRRAECIPVICMSGWISSTANTGWSWKGCSPNGSGRAGHGGGV